MAGPYTFTIINYNARQIRGPQEFFRFSNIDVVTVIAFLLVFFFANSHRVSGTRQSDLRVINRGNLFQVDLSTFNK